MRPHLVTLLSLVPLLAGCTLVSEFRAFSRASDAGTDGGGVDAAPFDAAPADAERDACTPATETCDEFDNDCNETIDDVAPELLGTNEHCGHCFDACEEDAICHAGSCVVPDECLLVLGYACDVLHEAYVKPNAPEEGAAFGWRVAIDGDRIAVASPLGDHRGTLPGADVVDAGVVHVFARDEDGVWTQEARLNASNADAEDAFGFALAISGDLLAVGAQEEESAASGIGGDEGDDSFLSSGAVYLFRRSPEGVWAQEAYVKASNNQEVLNFGMALALEGTTLAVGSTEWGALPGVGADQDNRDEPVAGAVYIFEREDTGWRQTTFIKASNPRSLSFFGISLSLDGDRLAVGSPGEGSLADGTGSPDDPMASVSTGAVYLFERDGAGSWAQAAFIKRATVAEDDAFGVTVSLDGDQLAVGATTEDSAATRVDGVESDNSAEDSGAAYVFRLVEGRWQQEAFIKALNTGAGDAFARGLALSGDLLAVSASQEDGAGDLNPDAGAIYVFRRIDGRWQGVDLVLRGPAPGTGDHLGQSLALEGTTLVAGAHWEDSGLSGMPHDDSAPQAGALYIMRLPATWPSP